MSDGPIIMGIAVLLMLPVLAFGLIHDARSCKECRSHD